MATINLSLIADRTRYFMNEGNMSLEEAKTEALKQTGFEQPFSAELDTELNRLINAENMTDMSTELGNDREKLINRNSTEYNTEHEVNPTPDAEATTPTE